MLAEYLVERVDPVYWRGEWWTVQDQVRWVVEQALDRNVWVGPGELWAIYQQRWPGRQSERARLQVVG